MELDDRIELGPVRTTERLHVGVLGRDPVDLADPDDLLGGRQKRLARAPDVARIQPVERTQLRRQVLDLLGGREDPGCVEQPGRQAPGTFLHRFPELVAHPRPLVRRELAAFEPDLVDAQGAMGDHRHDVEHQAMAVQIVQVVAKTGPGVGQVAGAQERRVARQLGPGARVDRRGRIPAVPGHQRRDALGGERGQDLPVRLVGDDEVAVRMDVDEAGRDDPAGRIDHRRSGRVVGDPSDRGDHAVTDPDVGREPRVTRAVDDAPVPDQDIEHGLPCATNPRTQKPGFAARYASISSWAFLCSAAGSAPWNAAETAASTTSEIFW